MKPRQSTPTMLPAFSSIRFIGGRDASGEANDQVAPVDPQRSQRGLGVIAADWVEDDLSALAAKRVTELRTESIGVESRPRIDHGRRSPGVLGCLRFQDARYSGDYARAHCPAHLH